MSGTPKPIRRHRLLRAAIGGLVLTLLSAPPGRGFTLFRSGNINNPTAAWPMASLPLPTLISSAGSDNVPDSSDTNAIIAGENTWTQINTDYFAFAAPTVGTGTAFNGTDGKNSIFFDETGTVFPPGTTAIAITFVTYNISTGVISDADLIFNGRDNTFSTATPTPSTAFDIQSIATHELGHMTGLGHAGLMNAAMFPVAAMGDQSIRKLSSDDRIGSSSVYPETAGAAGMAGLQAGDGDLNATTGAISGTVQTSAGVPVPGAHVTALDSNGSPVVSDVSHPDGSYRLIGLSPGGYQVYAEPLDGITIEQDLAQSDFMNCFSPFTTTFRGGNSTPTTVSVAAGATSSGNTIDLGSLYGVETEANNTAPAANPVALEALISGVVNPQADADYFSFPGATGDFISVDVDSDGVGCPLDPVLTLYSTNGTTQLATNDDFLGKGNDSRVARMLAATGTFYVKVVDFAVDPNCPDDGPGSFYTLHVNKAIPETEANNTLATANPMDWGQYRGGIISTSGDLDWYSFTVGFGDDIHAELTANRQGADSSLNPLLILFRADGTELTRSTDIDAANGNRDCLIDYHVGAQALDPVNFPATFYLRISATTGAGATAFYILHLTDDFPNLEAMAANTFGAGLGGSFTGANVVPIVRPQASSIDLIVAGEGIPFDPILSLATSGTGVTFTTSAGPDFGINTSGIDFFAMSASIASNAAPGPRTVFMRDGSIQAAIGGGLVITPLGVPPEVGAIQWSLSQMGFPADPSAGTWNIYRGNLPLVDANLNGVADNYGSPFACGLSSPLAADPSTPAVGGGFYYIATARNLNGEGTLGFTRPNSGPGVERPKSALTGTCP